MIAIVSPQAEHDAVIASRSHRPGRLIRCVAAVLAAAAFTLAVGASDARPAKSDAVTINLLITTSTQPGWQVLIPNFERVYPNIRVNATYVPPGAAISQLESTELAAGNGPDLVAAAPGCGSLTSICELAKAGYLLPLVKEPWAKRSLPLVTSADKYGQGLFAFTPQVDPYGVFTNDDLFKKLGLKIPQTFSQLLTVCQKAKADGTAAILLGAANPFTTLIANLAVATVYGKDKTWPAELRAGKVTFDGTAGWHQALQEIIEMSNAGCFQPGATGTGVAAALAEFAQGQGLMAPQLSVFQGKHRRLEPAVRLLVPPVSGRDRPEPDAHTCSTLAPRSERQRALERRHPGGGQDVHRLHRAPQAERSLRPDQRRPDAIRGAEAAGSGLHVRLRTGTQGSRLRHQPSSDLVERECPDRAATGRVGLLTGQESIDDILNAMDAAWKQGPS